MKKDLKPGMLVRYADGWCSEGEKKHVHLILENYLNPVTGEMTRWLIVTITTSNVIKPQEVVDDYMIEPIES